MSPRHRTLCAALFTLAALAGGCKDDQPAAVDAGVSPADAAAARDAVAPGDGGTSLTWVTFAASGCVADEPAGTCRGQAPLTVNFSAVAPAPVDVHVWQFGDESPNDDGGDGDGGAGADTDAASVTHVYTLPGSYDVTLTVRGPGGSATVTRAAAIVVEPAAQGSACSDDAQCQDDGGGDCVCDERGDLCTGSMGRGLCSSACSSDDECGAGVCAALATGEGTGAQDWQRNLCVPACGPEGHCPEGLTCQPLLAGDGQRWVDACFVPAVLAPIGGSCLSAGGEPVHAACSSGLCLELGARGACASPCPSGACPSGAACADIDGLGAQCVARCQDPDSDCDSDPWLACEAPAEVADGFTVDEPPAAAGYCTRRRCQGDGDCGSEGTCAATGYCAR